MTVFIRGDLHQRVQDGFSTLFSKADVVRIFGKNLKLSRIAAVPQEHRRPRLILNLLAQPNKGMQSVNDTTVRESTPESMKFGHAFPHILQEIWEADLVQGSV